MSLDPPGAHEVRQFPAPTGIPTSVTLHELALLQRFAHEAGTVLEIGTHYGFSCIGMALAGAHVTSVDPHYEGPANAPDTWEPFLANCRRHGMDTAIVGGSMPDWWEPSTVPEWWTPSKRPVINALRGTIENSWLGDSRFASEDSRWRWGMAFIDGDHVWPCPWRDTKIAMAHLTEPGYIAFHDVTPNWPGVYRAALQLEAKGWREVGRCQTLRVYQRPAIDSDRER